MPDLAHQRCFNHDVREAAARCPECTRYFCRECITEHEDRVVCAACLRELSSQTRRKLPSFAALIRVVQCVLALLMAWFFFFVVGESLSRLPDSFHETELWQQPWSGPE